MTSQLRDLIERLAEYRDNSFRVNAIMRRYEEPPPVPFNAFDYKLCRPQIDLLEWEMELVYMAKLLEEACIELENWESELDNREEEYQQWVNDHDLVRDAKMKLDVQIEQYEQLRKSVEQKQKVLDTSPEQRIVKLRETIAKLEATKQEAQELRSALARERAAAEAASLVEARKVDQLYADFARYKEKAMIDLQQICESNQQHRATSDSIRETYTRLMEELRVREKQITTRERAQGINVIMPQFGEDDDVRTLEI